MHRNFWTCDRSATSDERALLDSTFPAARLANLMQLSHNASVDLYCEKIVAEARLVVVHLLGGKSCCPYGVEQIVETCAGTERASMSISRRGKPDGTPATSFIASAARMVPAIPATGANIPTSAHGSSGSPVSSTTHR